jgi:hypothetical protein
MLDRRHSVEISWLIATCRRYGSHLHNLLNQYTRCTSPTISNKYFYRRSPTGKSICENTTSDSLPALCCNFHNFYEFHKRCQSKYVFSLKFPDQDTLHQSHTLCLHHPKAFVGVIFVHDQHQCWILMYSLSLSFLHYPLRTLKASCLPFGYWIQVGELIFDSHSKTISDRGPIIIMLICKPTALPILSNVIAYHGFVFMSNVFGILFFVAMKITSIFFVFGLSRSILKFSKTKNAGIVCII